MHKKIAVIGERASVMGFASVGFEAFVAETAQEIEDITKRLVAEEYGVVFLTEQALEKTPGLLSKYKDTRIPAIIPIPGRDGSLGIGMRNLHKSVERAVGADILRD
ncbi:MAG: V-type ATP synthase subunit F [Oscillospiraceae bacterium]|jgi:V/A-type H+-transporting ATPase subunit F|nr:V-type ATP synthase subunit F [Oscillospiraceae bacterium]